MDETKWMAFIRHYWGAVYFCEMIKQYRKQELSGTFFALSALATRNELLMRIDQSVHLCDEIAREYDVGNDARKTLEEIKSLHSKGETRDRSVLEFQDCGVKTVKDRILSHPLNTIKAVLGKDQYQISLKWETVELTLKKIREFADQVESHKKGSGEWSFGTHKEDLGDIELAFGQLTRTLNEGIKYHKLKLDILLKGGVATVFCDGPNGEIVIREENT